MRPNTASISGWPQTCFGDAPGLPNLALEQDLGLVLFGPVTWPQWQASYSDELQALCSVIELLDPLGNLLALNWPRVLNLA